MANPYRDLPSVHDLLEEPSLQPLLHEHGREVLVPLVREELDLVRQRLGQGHKVDGLADRSSLVQRVAARLDRDFQPRLRLVLNATGILLHTNLGRAPMAAAAAQAAHDAARAPLNLELNLETGQRSSRQDAIRDWLCLLTGAESATAVNNNAAATVIALRALCVGREVILSRGQLIEIGGSFRIPEIMSVSGAVLREVGTTNITRLADYERAIGPNTAALMRIHPSNYRISGFTESVALADLIALGRKHQLPVLDDIGSGALMEMERFGLHGEPAARESVRAGADLVLFSGDKLLGGPQAGILVGKADWIRRIEADPLMRAFRLDKMTLAALEATLRIYLHEERALREVPLLRMLTLPIDELRRRSETLAERIRALPGIEEVVGAEDVGYVGGGSLPDQALPSIVLSIRAKEVSETELAHRLRIGRPAVVARTRDGRLLLDLRTIPPDQDDTLVEAIASAL